MLAPPDLGPPFVPPPIPSPRHARVHAAVALWVIAVVGLLGSWLGGGLAAWLAESCWAAWSVWAGFCGIWWFLLLTS